MKSVRLIWIFVILATLVIWAAGGASCGVNQKEEERMGASAAQEVDHSAKLVTDPAITARVDRVGQAIAAIANQYEIPAHYGCSQVFKFKYKFKVIDDKEVNAFSLPGGHIYINSGLLDLMNTDDELAGVLAHECAHAAHHHMAFLLKKQSRMDQLSALVALAAVLGNVRGADLNNLLLGTQLLKTGSLSSYTQQAEKDADRTAVSYLVRSQYNPQGLLEVMRKLEAKEEESPELPLGIYQDHPASYKRANAVIKAMREEGVKVDLRKVRGTAYAQSVPVGTDGKVYQVVISKQVVYEPASLASGVSSKTRADSICKTINTLLDSGIKAKDICEDPAGNRLVAKGVEVIKVEREDRGRRPRGRDRPAYSRPVSPQVCRLGRLALQRMSGDKR